MSEPEKKQIKKLLAESKLIVYALFFVSFIWCLDAVIDYLFFFDRSFLDILILNVPTHDLFTRIMTILSFIVFGIIIFRDINLRKKAETQIQLQSTALESAANAIVITDPLGTIQWVNPAFTLLTGYSLEEVLAQNPRLLKSDMYDESFYKNLWNTITAGEIWQGQITNKRKNGTLYSEEMTIAPVLAGAEITNFIAIKNDITGRVKLETELRESEERYRIFFENNDAIILFINPENGKIIFANQSAVRFYGYTKEQLIGMNINKINILAPDEIQKRMAAAKQKKQNYFVFKHRLANDEIRDVEVYQTKLNVSGEDVFSIIMHDITERKLAEEEILRMNQELEQRVLERTQEIESFSYSVSHDLRAPLRAIAGYSDILLRDYVDDFNDEVGEHIQKIQSASEEMNDLISGMLSLSRLSRENLNYSMFSPTDLAQQIFYSLRAANPDRDIEFRPTPCVDIYGDAKLIKIMLTNLLSNAIKFTREEENALIECGYRLDETVPVFYVRDNGVGFNMAYADKIFTPFQRLHQRDRFEGTGIGLAIAHQVIQRHKGKIWVESTEGEGTTVYFTIGTALDQQRS